MIRRDYLLRMIEELAQALSRIRGWTKAGQLDTATAALDQEFQKLVGQGPDVVAGMSETELKAAVMKGEPTQVVRDKCLMLVSLLHEAAEIKAAVGHTEDRAAYELKALNLLLETLGSSDGFELPEFVPQVDRLAATLKDYTLPLGTSLGLMRYYEQMQRFGLAEDALFAALENAPQNRGLLEFALAFYERLAGYSNSTLESGDLPRPEVEAGLAEVRKRAQLLPPESPSAP
jgi:Family of unknown function (DUF6483)